MTTTNENPDTIIADIHQIREEIAAKFQGDLYAITADARARMQKSGRKIMRRDQVSEGSINSIVDLDQPQASQPAPTPGP